MGYNEQWWNMADRSLFVNSSFYFFFCFWAPHISVAWTTTMAPVSILGEGGGRLRLEHTRPAWGCSDTSHGCTLSSGLLLLQTTMSLYSETDKPKNWDHGKLSPSPTIKSSEGTRDRGRSDHIKQRRHSGVSQQLYCIIFSNKRHGWLLCFKL